MSVRKRGIIIRTIDLDLKTPAGVPSLVEQ